MENEDLIYLCTAIGNLSSIPIRIYKKDERIFYYALVDLPKDPMVVYQNDIWAISSHVGYYAALQNHWRLSAAIWHFHPKAIFQGFLETMKNALPGNIGDVLCYLVKVLLNHNKPGHSTVITEKAHNTEY